MFMFTDSTTDKDGVVDVCKELYPHQVIFIMEIYLSH